MWYNIYKDTAAELVNIMMLDMYETAAYIRLSSDDGDKEESNSVGNQRKLILNYIKKKQDLKYVGEYVDDGYTGLNFKRPGFQKLLNDIKIGKINCVIVKDLSRFGRDYIETGRYLERYFPDMGVRFIAITDGIDSDKGEYDMLLPIKNLFNQQYAKDISGKVYSAVKTKQQAGEFIGAFPSYGYKKAPDNKNRLIIDEPAAEVVRRIYSMYLQGYGKQTIAKKLNEDGIPCPTEYKRLNGDNYINCRKLDSTMYWTQSTIKHILSKEIYTGNMVQGTRHQRMKGRQKLLDKSQWIVVRNTHEPIIDRETWDKVQVLLKRQHRDLELTKNNSIFAGFLKCGDCGRSMMKNSWKRADGSRTYSFYCGTYKRNGTQFCSPHTLPAALLEQIVLDDLKMIIQNVSDLKKIVDSQSAQMKEKTKSYEKKLHQLSRELERVKNLKRAVYEDYREDLISKKEFIEYREEYLKQEEHIQKQIDILENAQEDNPQETFHENPWVKRLLEMRDIEKLDRDIVVEMIDEIRVYENMRIVIRYNFSDEFENLFPETCELREAR